MNILLHQMYGFGNIDIYTGGLGAKLYLNNRDGTFTDITATSGAHGQLDSDRTITFNDYNNDGWLRIETISLYLPEI